MDVTQANLEMDPDTLQTALISCGVLSMEEDSMDMHCLNDALTSCGILALPDSQMQDRDVGLKDALQSCGILSLQDSQEKSLLPSSPDSALTSRGILSISDELDSGEEDGDLQYEPSRAIDPFLVVRPHHKESSGRPNHTQLDTGHLLPARTAAKADRAGVMKRARGRPPKRKRVQNYSSAGRPSKRKKTCDQPAVPQRAVIREPTPALDDAQEYDDPLQEQYHPSYSPPSSDSSPSMQRDILAERGRSVERDPDYEDILPPNQARRSEPQDQAARRVDQALRELSREEIGTCVMARPIFWTTAYENLSTLTGNRWIDASVANFYLASIWHEVHGHTAIRFADMYAVQPAYQRLENNHDQNKQNGKEVMVISGVKCRVLDVTASELAKFMQDHYIPLNHDFPLTPVAFVVFRHQHFFVAIFDYERHRAYVLGRQINGHNGQDTDWTVWNGPHYWSRVAQLHVWDPGNPEDVQVLTKDWQQNGHDCGPIACAVLQRALKDGLDETWRSLHDGHNNIPCGHILRRTIMTVVRARCLISYRDYMNLRTYPPPGWDDLDLLRDDMIDEFASGGNSDRDNQLLRTLVMASNSCIDCRRGQATHSTALPLLRHETRELDEASEEEVDIEEESLLGEAPMLSEERGQNLMTLIKVNKVLHGARNRLALRPRALGPRVQPLAISDAPTPTYSDPEGDGQRSAAAKASRRWVKDWHLGSLQRFPRRTAPIPLPAYDQQRFLERDHNFDEYERGPTIEVLQPPPEVYPIFTWPFEAMTESLTWTMWRDHGYRILPSSFQMFYLTPPIALMDHIMTIGEPQGYDPRRQVPDRVTGNYDLRRGTKAGGERGVHVPDVEIMSAAEMLHCAGESANYPNVSRDGHNTFVRGKLINGTSICVDLEKDGISFDVDDIDISVDIDSIIWSTKTFVCQESIGINMMPPFESKPGIFKHNHAYVDILIPQSELDQFELGGRSEWLSKKFPMSAIPHTTIGRIGSSSGHDMAVYIMFPRMIQRNPFNGRRVNMMSHETLDIFWDMVLLPSLSEHAKGSWTPYMDQTLVETRYKARQAGHGGRTFTKTIPLSNKVFIAVQQSMRRRILDGLESLSMFGSFFFVLEGKGIKLLTKDGQNGVHQTPEVALRCNLSSLNWDYMLDRKNGELLVDIGVSFTPMSSVPVTGLWRLDALEESYGAGGFNRGTIHHQCMLSRYGALQAEMGQERTLQTHVAFRSTYNLYYEAVRTANNTAVFAKDSEAYNVTPNYVQECEKAINIFKKAKRKTYGVRDEYRVSGQAAQILLREIIPKAQEYMASTPVLWLKSETWFDFLARRSEEVQKTQMALSRRNPPNLGILTGILNHMLRCVTSTPIVFDYHVRESLALLGYRNVLETANMFFLQDLDINGQPCLEEVQEVDDMHVLALMGFNAKAQRDRAITSQTHATQAIGNQESFPIGARPTWAQLKKAISSAPGIMLRAWSWSSELLGLSVFVIRLFCTFTNQLWMMLSEDEFKGVVPVATSLEDAMRCWTVTSIDDTLHGATFEACNVGLENPSGSIPGCRGPRVLSFMDRMEVFFPEPGSPHRQDSQWSIYWSKEGYIHHYHQLLDSRSEEDKFYLKDALANIFSKLQCLPTSERMTVNKKGLVWKRKENAFLFVTNPKFYKVEGIAKEQKSRAKVQEKPRGRGVKSRKVFAQDLWISSGYHSLASRKVQTDRQKRRDLQKRLSAVSKNKRQPPTRKNNNAKDDDEPIPFQGDVFGSYEDETEAAFPWPNVPELKDKLDDLMEAPGWPSSSVYTGQTAPCTSVDDENDELDEEVDADDEGELADLEGGWEPPVPDILDGHEWLVSKSHAHISKMSGSLGYLAQSDLV
ncbi:hypothetical protein HYDPIDRAFT_33862 [Hydnomerulius pinastri MD-312]|uniref:Unplaced genomic scaffold scaffold_78, whole genome shotgun sequence n=1 Tax=Hydnomerulius pinastri MD-312 TaxID=994086 RepID=A0A0C9V0J6_9AGAM|nr:hypothetical protein HYDPIDRAFT_33862 [Hydnomerulius pinastri MD-312]